jgi:type IV pilus assembly protein PilW
MMKNSFNSRQTGITVVEILVAVALSLIILAGVMHIFINNKQTYRVQEAFARLQENGRFAIHMITKDLRMAGYMGCASSIASPGNIVNLDGVSGADDVSTFQGNGLEGFEYSNLPITLNSVTQLTTSNVKSDTDIVRIKRGSASGIHPIGPMQSLTSELKLPPALADGLFSTDDILMVTDCEHADTFAASNVISATVGTPFIQLTHDGTNNIVPPQLSTIYKEDAEVMKLINHTYYISNNTAGIPSLYRMSMGNGGSVTPEELVEGIEDMQLFYGEDTDDDGILNNYKVSTDVGDWDKVVSVRIELQAISVVDNVTAEEDPFYKDRRLRRKFTTSIALRNQL